MAKFDDVEAPKKTKLLHDIVLDGEGGDGISKTYMALRPQFSGMSFARFSYAPGAYKGCALRTWSFGVVRNPYQLEACEFGPTRSHGRTVCTGEVVIIPPGTDYVSASASQAEIDYLIVTPERFNAAMDAQHSSDLFRPETDESFFHSPVVATLVQSLIKRAQQPDSFDPSLADNFINSVVSEISQMTPREDAQKNRDAHRLSAQDLKRLDDQIHQSLDTPLTNATLASEMNLPEATFMKLFKASTGETPYQYILKKRIERAEQMLRNSQQSIAQIAFLSGFSSQSHMTDVFRARVGATPAAVRKTVL